MNRELLERLSELRLAYQSGQLREASSLDRLVCADMQRWSAAGGRRETASALAFLIDRHDIPARDRADAIGVAVRYLEPRFTKRSR